MQKKVDRSPGQSKARSAGLPFGKPRQRSGLSLSPVKARPLKHLAPGARLSNDCPYCGKPAKDLGDGVFKCGRDRYIRVDPC